jgi:hypothetical protein
MQIEITLQLLVLIFLLTGCNKTTSDAEIRQKIVGTWAPLTSSVHPQAAAKTEIRSDGGFTSRWRMATNERAIEGTWNVQDGFVTFTKTNVVGADLNEFGVRVQHSKIVRIESREMVLDDGDPTDLTTMERK